MSPGESHTYTREELLDAGVQAVGEDVRVDRSVRLFGAEHLRLGSRVRIDCFCVLSAGADGIAIGDNVHLAVGVSLFGGGGRIVVQDFAGLSSRVSVYTANDDYSRGFLTGPTVPAAYRAVQTGDVTLDRHAIIGSGAVILPGVRVGWGAAVGALTLVRSSVPDGVVVFGNPMRTLPRTRDTERLRALERQYLSTVEGPPLP